MSSSMPIALATAAGLALGAFVTSGVYAGSGSDVSDNAKTACMLAVNTNYGGKVETLNVVGSEFSESNSVVTMEAEGIRGGSASERWRCLVSNDGTVQELSIAP